jgi:3',5'-cyclic AMP phosphodiesterase CpdA
MTIHSLLQLSDPHITVKGELAYGRVDTHGMFAKAIKAIEGLAIQPDAIVITGDLVYRGAKAEYQALKALLEPIKIPIYLLPGNHDSRELLREVFSEHAYLSCFGSEPICYDIALPGRRVLCLDTSIPGKSHGALCQAQLEWLDQELGAGDDTPVVIAMHHPPFKTHIDYMDRIGLLEGQEKLIAILERHRHVDRVIAGHLHRFIVARIAGCAAVTAPSTAHQIALNLTPDATGMWIMEPPGYLLHVWEGKKQTITHQVSLAETMIGPYPFRGEQMQKK